MVQLMRFLLFRLIPLSLFLVICFSESLRVSAALISVAYVVAMAVYAKDMEGRKVIFGMRKDWFNSDQSGRKPDGNG